MEAVQKRKKVYIQVLSVISSFAVVALHVNGCFWTFSYDRYWITANMIECFFYFAVPVFFMISGATLIDYPRKYSTKEFIKKRVRKTVIPFLIWSVIGMLWRSYKGSMDIWEEVRSLRIISDVLNTSIINIYWFFIPLFAVYLSIPLLAAVSDEKKKKVYTYITAAAFLFNSFLPLAFSMAGLSYSSFLYIPVAMSYIPYVLLGYLLDRYLPSKRTRIVIYLLGLFGLAVHIAGTQILSYEQGEIVQLYKGYKNVPCFLYSTAVFVFFRNMDEGSPAGRFLGVLTRPFASVTFGVYLIHWFMLQIVQESALSAYSHSIIYRTAGTVVIFLLCAGIVKLIQLIPGGSKLLPS